MPQAPPPPTGRHDAYAPYRFRLAWDARVVAGFEKARLSADSRLSPLQLERGITLDARFDAWAHGRLASAPEVAGLGIDLVLQVLDLQGRAVVAYALAGCRPLRCEALPDIDASANAVAFAALEIGHAGWQRIHDAERRD